jgi:Lamin Tail Domain/CotH kinase protein/Fn3 associated/Chitobiase/beta-hexosaminidase C-terminal domain
MKMMVSRKGYCFLLFAVICILTATTFASRCPSADLNGNCWVDIYDLQIFADQWLNAESCEETVTCADFDGLNGIDFADFSILASQWQTHGSMLFINEFMASNNSASGIHDSYGDYDDWLEIYNIGDTPVDMAGMYLTDDLANPTKYHIPTGYSSQTTIPARGFLVFWADDETTQGPLHTNFKLSGDGEEIGLYDTDGVTQIDAIVFGAQATDISYGRYPDGEENWCFFSTATPGAANKNAYLGDIDNVDFSKERGFYDSNFMLTLACTTSGTNIYYTTDGRPPIAGEVNTPTSIRYTTPISINSTNCIRAAAIKTGYKPSPIETHTYIFGASAAIKAMPLVSLVGDPNQTFYEPNGIMAIVGGYYASDGTWQSGGTGTYDNMLHRGIAYERPVSFEIIGSAADGNYQTDCGIRIHGSDYTRPRYTRGDDWLCTNNKISFNLYFRSDYGDSKFEYPFFPFTPEVDSYQSMALRGGHNDLCSPFVKDEWTRRLFKEMGGPQVTGTFVNLYINGVYRYYYNPIARDDADFFQDFYGSNYDFDVITQSGLRDGDTTAWNNLVSYATNHDLSNFANYNYFASKFDVVSFIDYLIVQIHSGNFDWPGNNWTANCEKSDTGMFRFTIWDADGIAESWIFGNNCEYCNITAFDSFPNWTSPTGLNNLAGDPISEIYRALKTNPDFRQLFADRIHKNYHNGGVMTQSHLIDKWWEVQNEVSSVLPYQDTYVPNVFLPNREPYVLLAFENNGLYNRSFGAPVFNVNGSYKFGGYVSSTDSFTITDPCNSGGTIYYTTDGSDPRLPAGATITPSITLVAEDANKKVLVPTSNIGSTWRLLGATYNDSSWTSGHGGVGYEYNTGYAQYIDINVGSAMYNINATCYIRIPFTVNISNITSLTLRMMYDDGFLAYLNGVPVASRNAPASPTWNSTATSNPPDTTGFEDIDITAYMGDLTSGSNYLAIQGLNTSTTSSDFLIDTELVCTVVSSDANVSPTAIQYTGAFTLNKSTDLKSRIYNSSTKQWSPLNEAPYEVGNLQNSLRITEIMYHPQDTNDPNDPNKEYIELKNIGSGTINLNLVKFDKGINFTFGPNTLAAGQYILVVKDQNAFVSKYGTGRYIAGQYTGSLSNGGERLRLLDAVGGTILDFNYNDSWRDITDGGGYSLTIINPSDSDLNDWGKKNSWRASAYIGGSPGWDDSNIIPNPGAIVINELLAHSHNAASDWIELKNTTTSTINIGGWYLSDDDSNLMKYRFASGTTIPANGYLVVYESNNFGAASSDPGRLIPFALSENGESACLTSALDANGNFTGYRDKEDFGASETDVSFGRYYKASNNNYDFVSMSTNTPGATNAYPQVGPIIFSEIMYHPDWPASGSYSSSEYEYIELLNISASPVTLYDSNVSTPWKFTDGITYTFPVSPAVTIAAGAKILVVSNVAAFEARYPSVPTGIIYGPYSGKLANDGEAVELSKPGDLNDLGLRQYILVERVNYSDGSHPNGEPCNVDLWPTGADGSGKSLMRISATQYGNDPNNWTAATPTPGS